METDEALVVLALTLQDQFGLAGKVVLVELDAPTEVCPEAEREPVRVLPNDEVTFLQPHDPLRLDTERPDSEIGAGVEECLPHVQPVRGRNVDLVAQLAGETNPPHEAVGDAGHSGSAHMHVWERIVREVDALHHPADQFAALGPGDVHARVAGGDRSDVHLPVGVLGLQPALRPLPDRRRSRRRRGHDVAILGEPAGDAIVHHHAVLGTHHPVPHCPDREL